MVFIFACNLSKLSLCEKKQTTLGISRVVWWTNRQLYVIIYIVSQRRWLLRRFRRQLWRARIEINNCNFCNCKKKEKAFNPSLFSFMHFSRLRSTCKMRL